MCSLFVVDPSIISPNELSPCQAHPHPESSQRLVEERAMNKSFMGLTRGWWRVPVPHCYFCSIFPKACLFCIVYMGRYMLCVLCMCRYLQRPKEGVRSPVAGVIGSCELPIVGSSVVLETEIRASGRV